MHIRRPNLVIGFLLGVITAFAVSLLARSLSDMGWDSGASALTVITVLPGAAIIAGISQAVSTNDPNHGMEILAFGYFLSLFMYGLLFLGITWLIERKKFKKV